MRVTEDDLRSLLAGPAASREACPSAETLAAAAAGTLPERERDAVLEHVGRCGDCAEEVRLLGPLSPWAQSAAARLQPASPPVAKAWWTQWPAWGAAAAVVVLGLSLVLWRPPFNSPGTLRTQREPAIRTLLPESVPLPRQRCVLRWSDAGEGARYSVSVLSKDLTPLASADGLDRPEYALSPDQLKSVPPGGEIVWFVAARWTDGRRLASPAFVTRLD